VRRGTGGVGVGCSGESGSVTREEEEQCAADAWGQLVSDSRREENGAARVMLLGRPAAEGMGRLQRLGL